MTISEAHVKAQFFLEDLVGSRIITPDGREIGHVVDVLVTRGPEYRVTHLLYGRHAWPYRLHLKEPKIHDDEQGPAYMIPWEDVERFEHFTVTLKSK